MSVLIHHARGQNILPSSLLGSGNADSIDQLMDRAMALANAGAWSCDLCDNRLTWTSGVYNVFGLPLGSTLDRRQTVEMYTEETKETMERLRAEAIVTGGPFAVDAQIKRPDGELRWVRINGEMKRWAGGASLLHGLKQDVTEEKLRLASFKRLAENDALTGLASRAVYETRFLNRLQGARHFTPLGALVLFDLDGFKGINDRLGHLAGDACLRTFAERLSAAFPNALLAARIGGDEFAVLVSNEEPASSLEARVNRFLMQAKAPIAWREHIVAVGATSGVAFTSDPFVYDPEELFVRADAALYAAKKSRR